MSDDPVHDQLRFEAIVAAQMIFLAQRLEELRPVQPAPLMEYLTRFMHTIERIVRADDLERVKAATLDGNIDVWRMFERGTEWYNALRLTTGARRYSMPAQVLESTALQYGTRHLHPMLARLFLHTASDPDTTPEKLLELVEFFCNDVDYESRLDELRRVKAATLDADSDVWSQTDDGQILSLTARMADLDAQRIASHRKP